MSEYLLFDAHPPRMIPYTAVELSARIKRSPTFTLLVTAKVGGGPNGMRQKTMNAENNRTPFDLPEAESELVAGYHTEYSAMKFAFFMLAEYSMMIVNSCLIVTLFFGGWTLGMFGFGLTTDVLRGMGIAGGILGAAIFFTKAMLFLLCYVWFRATFPRFRFDQLMDLGWKWLIPLSLANIFVTGIFILIGQELLMSWIGVVMIGLTAFYLFKPRRKPEPAHKVVHAS